MAGILGPGEPGAILEHAAPEKQAEVQQDLGFTHCHTCGFEIFDCECPEQIDLEDLL